MFIKVKVSPGCKRDEIVKKKDDEFEVKVKEKAEEGRENGVVFTLHNISF
jgi:uncharacterized protein YggU (UPF0235/DUF167 family)